MFQHNYGKCQNVLFLHHFQTCTLYSITKMDRSTNGEGAAHERQQTVRVLQSIVHLESRELDKQKTEYGGTDGRKHNLKR